MHKVTTAKQCFMMNSCQAGDLCWLLNLSLRSMQLDPRRLSDQVLQRGERDSRVRGKPRARVRRKRRKRGIAYQEYIEILGKVLVASRGFAKTHFRGISRQQHVANLIVLEKLPQRLITGGVIDHHVIRLCVDIARNRNRQLPKSGVVKQRTGV